MLLRIRVLSVVAALAATTGIAEGQQLGAPPIQTSGALADSLKAFITQMGSSFHSLEAEKVIAMYGDPGVYVHINNGVVGTEEQTAARLRAMSKSGAVVSPVTFFGDPNVIVLDSNVAVVYYQLRIDAPAGQLGQAGVWTGVLRRGADGWKIIHSHASTHPVPATG